MITVRVFHSNGQRPVPNKKVSLHDSTGYRNGTTDASGSVNFDARSGNYKVYVDGKTVHDGPIVGVIIVYV